VLGGDRLTAQTDVLVIGGGPAGIATALALRGDGFRVQVAERSGYERVRVGETFPPSIRPCLAKLGVWRSFLLEGHLRSPAITSAWGGSETHDQSHIFSPYGVAWHVDRRRFDLWLAREAVGRGIPVAPGVRLRDTSRDAFGKWSVRVDTPAGATTVQASYLADATGRTSSLARRLDRRRVVHDRLVGLYRFFSDPSHEASSTEPEGSGGHELPATGLVEAVEDGWWYSAPIPDGRLVAALMTDADIAARQGARDPTRWHELMQRAPHTWLRIRRLRAEGAPKVFAANTSRLDTVFGSGWLAVGDAAMTHDPLSGDGVCRALRQGLAAAAAIRGDTDGDAAALPEYGRAVDSAFDEYLRVRAVVYGLEDRWHDATFWARRHREGTRRSISAG